jgi:ABC-type Mn2+/Zn2+ transport system ATPase subunit
MGEVRLLPLHPASLYWRYLLGRVSASFGRSPPVKGNHEATLELNFDHFTLAYSDAVLFEDWNLSVVLKDPSGARNLGIMGSSGIGKTSLLRAILQRARHRDNSIGLSPDTVTISYVPQEPVLFRGLSLRGNARYLAFSGLYQNRFDQALFDALATRLHLSHILTAKRDAATLSGGERQRIMLLRALSIRPELLVLDEPCSGMDLAVKQEFLFYLRSIVADLGVAIVYVSHHWDEIQLLCEQVLYLTREGSGEALPVQPMLRTSAMFFESPPTLGAFHSVFGLQSTVWPVQSSSAGRYLADVSAQAPDSDWILACGPLMPANLIGVRPPYHSRLLRTKQVAAYRIAICDGEGAIANHDQETTWEGSGAVFRKSLIFERVEVRLTHQNGSYRLCANSMS